MTATNETTNYKLPLFTDNDQPTWLGDFNGAMDKIDAGITTVGANASTALSAANNAVARVATVENTVTAVQTTANNALSLAQSTEDDLANYAEKDHAATTTAYGAGDATHYGHVKVSDALSTLGAADNVAASPAALKKVATRIWTGSQGAPYTFSGLNLNNYILVGVEVDGIIMGWISPKSTQSQFLGQFYALPNEYHFGIRSIRAKAITSTGNLEIEQTTAAEFGSTGLGTSVLLSAEVHNPSITALYGIEGSANA